MRRILLILSIASACSHELTSPTPTLASVAPDLVCNGPAVTAPGGVTTVALAGERFTPMPSKTLENRRELILPKVTLTPVAGLPGIDPPAAAFDIADDPADPAASRVHWQSENAMSFDVAPADSLPAGVYDITVTNPDGSRASTLTETLALIPPPIVTAANPMAVCDDQQDQIVAITGTSFLFFDGASPTVTIATAGGPKTYTASAADADCAVISGRFGEQNVRLCSALSFTIPQGDIVVTENTTFDLIVTNPAPADCASSTGFAITIDAPPEVDSVVPATVCQGGAQVTVNGENFLPGATATLVCPSGSVEATTVIVNETGTQLAATFGGGAVPGEECDVVVTNPDGCDDRPLPHKKLSVVTGPIVFLVDPEVVFNGINTRITLFATTITQPLASDAVTIVKGGVSTTLQFNTVAGHPNRLQAIVPKDQAPGTYDVILKDDLGCPSILPAALTVTDTTTVNLENVNPPFGHTGSDTAVTIFRNAAAGGDPFAATPRVFLNPNNPQASDVAVPLEAVAFADADRVTGVVPASTPPKLYDVVLVNPDGTVGVLLGSVEFGYTATATPPPQIDTATPASIVALSGQSVTLTGTGFGAGNTVTLTCLQPDDTLESPLAVNSGTPTCPGGVCTQTITINASNIAAGSICIARLTNADGVFGEFSAIGVTNASLNLGPSRDGPLLNVGRRALSAVSGSATGANRFVYAIGGDDGTEANALTSVEFAPVDLFGTVGAYTMQPYPLRTKRTLAGAVTIGRYIYLVGGNDGAGATATAERALILSPREVPQISDVDMQLADVGLDPGTYRYRVSAVFAANDPHNPDGETLAGDELSVKVPSFATKKIELTLVWDEPVDALGVPLQNIVNYRIYRTAKDGASGAEVLLATVPASPRTFTDVTTVNAGVGTPLPLGSTGKWAALPNLGTVREGLAVAAVADPVTPGVFHVYALLGRTSSTTALASYEFLTVTAAPNGRQLAAATWTAGTATSGATRWQLGAWTVDRTVSPDYTGSTTFVFVGGGIPASGVNVATRRVEAGQVTAGGQLASFDNAPTDFNATIAGYGVCAANDQLFTFGGVNAQPNTGANSATLEAPPALGLNAWNNEGLNMKQARYLLGSTVQSALIFLIGGTTGVDAASRTTETVVW